ncbi:hypothetical protein [Streptomyces sp. SID3343]|uniref:hypothetical protein n=1 Tax=Streptomyces sp. SID3343 TaxID=2690260 RepID=UPI00136D9EE5|nr:hypothetical protein [Streptomyces sp. SID3343]MYW02823.1 hypothetical protein [Streptomyces sp. SID3343]
MPQRQPNVSLAALLAENHWTAGQLARAVNAMATAHGMRLMYDRTTIAHWLTGTRPRPPVPELVAAAFSRHGGRSITAADTGLIDRVDVAAAVERSSPNITHRLIDLCRADIDPTRHVELIRAIYTTDDRDASAWDSRIGPAHEDSPSGSGRFGATPTDAQTLREMADVFAELAERNGGILVRCALAAFLAEGADRFLNLPASEAVRREMLTGTAQLTHLLASMTADSDHPGLAQRYFGTALELAREAGDRRMFAITLRTMSVQALRLGHRPRALGLAEAALAVPDLTHDPSIQSFLLGQRALASAAVHRPAAARADLALAEDRHEHADGLPGVFRAYSTAGFQYQRALAFDAMDEGGNARASLRAAVRERDPRRRRALALTQARLAASLARVGEVEAACSHWHLYLDAYPHLRSVEIQRALARLLRTMRRMPRVPEVLALQERAESLAHG